MALVGLQQYAPGRLAETNQRQKEVLFKKISAHFGGKLKGRTIALWGLAFKPNTDDMRAAPSRTLMEALWAAGASVRAYDPVAMAETRRIYGERADLCLCEHSDEALTGADALAICTEWQEFRSPDFDFIREQAQGPGHLRRPQPLRPGLREGAGVQVLRHRAAETGCRCRERGPAQLSRGARHTCRSWHLLRCQAPTLSCQARPL